ncbi:MAG: N-acetylmuramoyl-L-alanine amidase [Eubacteriales bacterium]|nr:N-acetylmuramoyl-L-alanine amidase [Eubacteriales bacterium]MDD4474479.1 N-acetylmuramoyl-L-alanine amidase [Eubacteriales bacterium]
MELYDNLTVITNFIPRTAIIRPGIINNEKKCIVIHNTGNYSPTQDAKAHSDYLFAQSSLSDPRKASWHYTVDDKVVYYHIPDNENALHASDGGHGEGNFGGIGIEICVNGFPQTFRGEAYDEWEEKFKKTLTNSAILTASLLHKYSLDMSAIKQHYDFALDKKNCPREMRYTPEIDDFTRNEGKLWLYFITQTEKYYKAGQALNY